MQVFTVPNILTMCRIIGTICMIFVEPLSAKFYVIYTLAAITDLLDGYIARKFNQITSFGSTLDSIADILLYSIMMLMLMPTLVRLLPMSIWYMVIFVIIIRVFSYTYAMVKFKRFSSLHTVMNKMTGLAMFTVPYIIRLKCATLLCFVTGIIAIIASLQELFLHITRAEYTDKTMENKAVF